MSKKFDIVAYGATTDGTPCTKAIQSAIDACFLAGGGEVVVPTGTYLTGGIRLRSNVTLHLMENAVILGSVYPEDYMGYIDDAVEPIPVEERDQPAPTIHPDMDRSKSSAYPYSRWNNALIRAIKAKNIAIIGEMGSEINGQRCYDPLGEGNARGPHAINMWYCENVELRGYTIRDSANWAHALHNTRNIHADGVTVLAGHDGFDIRTCDDVLVENCVFRTGDDCIAGFDNINLTVRNCVFDSACQMLRLGGTNILIERCLGISPATYGYRGTLTKWQKANRMPANQSCRHEAVWVFKYYCDDRAEVRQTPGNICIRDCYFKNAKGIINVTWGHKWCFNRPLADIRFENCIFDGLLAPSELTCPEEEPLSVHFKNCTLIAGNSGEDVPVIVGSNVKQVKLERVKFQGFADPQIVCEPPAEVIVE